MPEHLEHLEPGNAGDFSPADATYPLMQSSDAVVGGGSVAVYVSK